MGDQTPPTYEEVQAEMIRQMGGPTPQPTSGDDSLANIDGLHRTWCSRNTGPPGPDAVCDCDLEEHNRRLVEREEAPQPTSGDDQPRWTIDSAVEAIRVASFEAPKAGSHTEWAHRIRDILVFLVADVRDHAAVTEERDALRAALEKSHARQITDSLNDHAALEAENARLWGFVRAYDVWENTPLGNPPDAYNRAEDGVADARAALGDTPD